MVGLVVPNHSTGFDSVIVQTLDCLLDRGTYLAMELTDAIAGFAVEDFQVNIAGTLDCLLDNNTYLIVVGSIIMLIAVVIAIGDFPINLAETLGCRLGKSNCLAKVLRHMGRETDVQPR